MTHARAAAPLSAVDALTLPAGGGPLPMGARPAFWFTHPGRVLSKANHRHSKDRARGTWDQLAGFEMAVAASARTHLPASWPRPTAGAPLAQRPRFAAYLLARTMLDSGNLDKSVLDALQGSVMVSDAQVSFTASATLATTREQGVFVALVALEPGIDVLAASDAGADLVRAARAVVDAAQR